MRFETLMLADNAAAVQGKLYIHGGGITRLTPPQLPWAHPMLTFVLQVVGDDVDDLRGQHQLRLIVADPQGGFIVGPADVTLQHDAPLELLEGEALIAYVSITVAPLLLATEGVHMIHVELDGEHVADLPLPVRVLGA